MKKFLLGVFIALLFTFSFYTLATSILKTRQGGTGNDGFSPNSILISGTASTSALIASSSPSIGSLHATTTATSSIKGGLDVSVLNVTSGSATSTFANGIRLSEGCFIDAGGSCITGGGISGSGAANQLAYWDSGSSIAGDSDFTVDAATGELTMTGADITRSTTTQATSTDLAIAVALVPDADDGSTLGYSGLGFSDLFFASGAVINFNAGDVTITHSANDLAFAGVTGDYSFDDAVIVTGVVTADGLTLGANENITLGAQTLDHNGTDFVFNDTINVTGITATAGTSTVVDFEFTDSSGTSLTLSGVLQADSASLTNALTVANGGTGATSLTDGSVIIGAGTGALTASSSLGSNILADDFLVNYASDVMTGTLTADGLTLGANENITLGAQTLDHDGTDFAFSDSINVTGTIFASVGFDCVGNVDCDYGSVDIDDHTFITDGTGDAEFVVPNDSIGPAEIDSTTGAYDFSGVTSLSTVTDGIVNAAGEFTVDTTSGQLRWYNNQQLQISATSSKQFLIASSTLGSLGQFLDGSFGTTTIRLSGEWNPITFNSVNCSVSGTSTAATAAIRLGDGAASTSYAVADDGGTVTQFSSNNAFTSYEDLYIEIGSMVDSPDEVSCSLNYKVTAD